VIPKASLRRGGNALFLDLGHSLPLAHAGHGVSRWRADTTGGHPLGGPGAQRSAGSGRGGDVAAATRSRGSGEPCAADGAETIGGRAHSRSGARRRLVSGPSPKDARCGRNSRRGRRGWPVSGSSWSRGLARCVMLLSGSAAGAMTTSTPQLRMGSRCWTSSGIRRLMAVRCLVTRTSYWRSWPSSPDAVERWRCSYGAVAPAREAS
jgi:hypothetical protein